jgi:hypothetical protein
MEEGSLRLASHRDSACSYQELRDPPVAYPRDEQHLPIVGDHRADRPEQGGVALEPQHHRQVLQLEHVHQAALSAHIARPRRFLRHAPRSSIVERVSRRQEDRLVFRSSRNEDDAPMHYRLGPTQVKPLSLFLNELIQSRALPRNRRSASVLRRWSHRSSSPPPARSPGPPQPSHSAARPSSPRARPSPERINKKTDKRIRTVQINKRTVHPA